MAKTTGMAPTTIWVSISGSKVRAATRPYSTAGSGRDTNLLATVLLSHGVPMLLGGDELCQTQQGNNNAYCQDNETTWLDWSLDEREREFLDYVRHLIAVRNDYPALRPLHYVETESPVPHQPGVVSWRDADGSEMMPGTWGRQEPRVLMLVIEPPEAPAVGNHQTLLLMFNGTNDARTFHIPKIGKRRRTDWQVILDTSIGSGRSEVVLTGERDAEIPRMCSADGGCAMSISRSLVHWVAAKMRREPTWHRRFHSTSFRPTITRK